MKEPLFTAAFPFPKMVLWKVEFGAVKIVRYQHHCAKHWKLWTPLTGAWYF
jgi:hypothetical protein